jgi:hypothetical protein
MPWFGKGRSDVPSAWAAALDQLLEALDPTHEIAEFVVTGQPAEALRNAKKDRQWARGSMHWYTPAAKPAMATLYAGFGDVDAAVLRRWGRVLDAAPRGGRRLGDVGGCHWPELMMWQAADAAPSGPLPFTFADLERIAAEDGTQGAELVRMAFTVAPYSQGGHAAGAREYLSRLPGFAEAVVAHRDVAGSALVSGSVEERVAAANLLGMLGDAVLGALAGPLVEAATSTSAQVRDAACPLLARIGGAAVGPLRAVAADGTPERRAHALDLLAARPDQRAWARQAAAADRAASVQALLARWDAADAADAAMAEEEPLPELAPLPPWSLPAADAERLANQVYEVIRQGIESTNRSLRRNNPNYPQLPEPPRSRAVHLAGLLAADRPVLVDAKLEGLPSLSYNLHQEVATLQAQRLYEAMCTERSWSAEDWDRYLLRHPVVGPAARRLVWVALAGDGAPVTFRPLDDGTLTDVGDNDVKLPGGARIRVAHDSALSPDEIERWSAHLADYEVTPLFQQLGRGVHVITPELRSKRQLTDFTGHLLEAYALRGRAGKLGYTRGQSEDAGWFYTYEKRFPTLGIMAVVSFTGNPLPEENRLVALKELSFRRETSDWRYAELALGDVPAVLVSECWQDMRLLAAEGTGFDPAWEKKSEF